MLRRLTSLCLSLCLLLAVAAPAGAYEGAFSDVPPTHWAAPEIEKAVAAGLMEGMGDGRFGLEQSMDRAAFVTVLCRMFSWPLLTPATPTYPDCAPGDWYYPSVETAAAHGVMDPTGTFRPTAPISRGEMAEMLVRALGYAALAPTAAAMTSPFADGAGNGYITLAHDVGMVNGAPGEGGLLFRPAANANREEAAAMLLRVYERYTQKLQWLHGFYAFDSFGQIGLTEEMDAVSVGWARLDYDPATGAFVNTTDQNGNDWREPKGSADVLARFAKDATPCNLNVYAGTGDKVTLPDGTETNDVYAIIATPASRKIAIDALVAAVPRFGGLTIDFEGMKGEDQKANFTAFMTELKAALPGGKTLYVCVPPNDWYTGFDYRALGEICDKVILMAHDYRWTSIPEGYVGTNKVDTPDSPLHRIYGALRALTHPQTGVADRSKIALAISFASVALEVDENGLLASTKIYHPAQKTILKRLSQPDTEVFWSEKYGTTSIRYTGDDGKRYLCWYEDARSVTAKIQLARMFSVNGLSLWRLGGVPQFADPGKNYNAWQAILDQR